MPSQHAPQPHSRGSTREHVGRTPGAPPSSFSLPEIFERMAPSRARAVQPIIMPKRAIATLNVPTRLAWRKWLQAHNKSESEIWLVFHKRHTSLECISYDDSVEEALCFGWIDSLVRRLDNDRYARKFTPRKPGSRWSAANRQRYAKLKDQGLLTAAGRARAPSGPSRASPSASKLPPHIEKELKASPRARAYFAVVLRNLEEFRLESL